MKTALLHYWLTNMRGGEKVLAALGEMLPDADIFTHAYIPEKVPEFSRFNVSESFIARLPLGRKHPQAYLPFMPVATRSLKLDGYGLIVSSESGPIKGIRKPKGVRHVCYCHTPMRYLWDMHDEYYRSAGFGGKLAMKLFTGYLRKEDLKSAEAVDDFVANSAFVAERIRRIYGRESTVVHPPVDVDFFGASIQCPHPEGLEPKSYYLYAGELRDYKRPDLAVETCLRMGRKLVVVGNGKMRESLMRRIDGKGEIVFLGRVSDDGLRSVFANARALLFPGVEDFGIVPVEAQAAGTPVIALGKGGALETVREGVTGLFFGSQIAESLCGAIEAFEAKRWDSDACRKNASKFSASAFKSRMRGILQL
jgi:glycosyltransferase involved in cell wall biosynthesis